MEVLVMNIEEKILSVAKNAGCGFYKYHDENEEDDIPDILNKLYDLRDDIKSNASKLGVKQLRGTLSYRDKILYDAFHDRLKEINTYIENVIHGDDKYYIMKYYITNDDMPKDVTPIGIKEVPVWSAKVGKDGIVSWCDTGKRVTTYIIDIGVSVYDIPEDDKSLGVVLTQCEFNGEGVLYIEPIQTDSKYFKCKDCGNYFVVTRSEENWYKLKELDLPKRCETCRETRKKTHLKDRYNRV